MTREPPPNRKAFIPTGKQPTSYREDTTRPRHADADRNALTAIKIQKQMSEPMNKRPLTAAASQDHRKARLSRPSLAALAPQLLSSLSRRRRFLQLSLYSF